MHDPRFAAMSRFAGWCGPLPSAIADPMNIITDTAALEAACERLAAQTYITVDTEFLREKTFWPVLCLIQVASPDDEFIVDPLADGVDLAPFWDLMANEAVLKVFHAARQDVEIVQHLAGIVPKPLFDTQVAASVCGYGESVGYGALVAQTTKGSIDKTSQFTDWSRRPLTTKQLDYALADVTWLREVYERLRDELAAKKRTSWMEQEMVPLTDAATYDVAPEDAWRRMKSRARKPIELETLKHVAAWRERQARERDIPRGRVLKDDALFEVATQRPTTKQGLGDLRAVPGGFENSRHAQGLLDAVADALAVPSEELPKLPRRKSPSEAQQSATELLKVLLRIVAEREAVGARVIASTDDLEKIAADDEADVPALKGWRREMFGRQALALKRGDIALGFDGRRAEVIELEPEEG